jgi:hypothetical protein
MKTISTATRILTAAVALGATVLGATALAAPTAHAADRDPLSGERRITLAPEGHEFALTIGRDGRATSSDRWGKRSQLVATPLGHGRYWLQTAHLRRGGEPLCLRLTATAVVTAACDASARHQRFRFDDAGENASGNPTYLVRTGARRHLVVDEDGAFVPRQVGEGTPDVETPFVLVDRGRAHLPASD